MLFSPTGFAVIGASREPSKVGHVVFKNLLKSKVKAYPVNLNAKSILGRQCYKSVIELKGKVSHAVIAVPARFVPNVIEECGLAGVKVAIIISAGFSEAGNKELEGEVMRVARQQSIKVIGPNVLGVIIPDLYNASFFEGEIKSGGVSFISQSGALGVGVLDSLIGKRGLRSFVSVGNTADVTITQVLKEVLADKGTKCVIIYAESLKQGREFMNTCKDSKKPVFILKAGVSNEGVKASATHTGSLGGSDVIYSAAFKQCSAIRVKSLSELISKALFFERYGFLGNKALIITNAGGPGILLTDALAEKGFELPSLPNNLMQKFNKELSGVAWSHGNPIDLVGDALAERYARVLSIIKNYEFYDFIVLLLTPQAMTQPLLTAKSIVKFKKPIIPCFIGGVKVKKAISFLQKNNLMAFTEINRLVESLITK